MTEKSGKPRTFTRRRVLLGTVALVGGGLALRWLTRDKPSLASGPDVLEPNAFLQITPRGDVIFQLDRVEMGQGAMTGLAVLLAEELDLDPARLEVRFAPVLSTFRRPLQLTGQSRSLMDSWDILRETGAAARAMLLQAAAERWQLAAETLRTDDGNVIDPASTRSLNYAELAEAAARLPVPRSVQLKPRSEWRWLGTAVPRLDAPVKVTGEAVYGIDVQLDNMLTAVIARCPELGAEVTDFDATAALARPGVEGVVAVPGGVAVVAVDFWTAKSASELIKLTWSPGPLRDQSDQTIRATQVALLDSDEQDYQYFHGAEELPEPAPDEFVLDAQYSTPYLAHATMEPMNATVHYRQSKVQATVQDNTQDTTQDNAQDKASDEAEVWVPTQWPDHARQAACDVLGLSREQVHVHTTWIGGGFGRRVLSDFVTEAAQIAKQFDVPIKLVWTREHDMQHGFYRQQSLHRLSGRVTRAGRIRWWGHRQVLAGTGDRLTPPTVSTVLSEKISLANRNRFSNWLGEKVVDWLGAFQAQEGAKELIYEIPDRSLEQMANNPGMPISIWRSVANSYNGFVVESFMDELAWLAGQDPLEFRRSFLQTAPEVLRVLDLARDKSGWGSPPPGRFQGVAIFRSFGTIVCQVAEVSVDSAQRIRVHRVCCAVDCGTVATPDIVRAQMESGIIYGLTAALYGEITMQAGQIVQSNFHDYPMLRMADAPAIDVHIVATTRDPAGVGEPGTPPIAPAVANAVFAATGQRLRDLPLRL